MDIERGKRKVVESLDLPKEIILGLPKITITSNEEIIIENHRGVLAFGNEAIKIQTKIGGLTIQGEGLEILYLGGETVIVGGRFKGVMYGE